MSKLNPTAKGSSRKGSKMGSCPSPLSSAISEHSSVKGTPQAIREWLTFCPPDFLANHFQSQDAGRESQTSGTSGPRPQTLFALSNLDTFCLRMCPEYCHTCPWSSETCVDLATPLDDLELLPPPQWARDISGSESGYVPTLKARDYRPGKALKRAPASGPQLTEVVGNGGSLNPPWTEWLKGFPIGWTELSVLDKHSFQQWLQQHGSY